MFSRILVALLVLIFSAQSFAIGEACGPLEGRVSSNLSYGPGDEVSGHVGIKGGVHPSPVRNQGDAQDCWAQTLAEVMTNVYRLLRANALDVSDHERLKILQNPREFEARVSPEHFLFWHLYHQIKTHLGTFRKLAKDLEVREGTDLQEARREDVEEAYGLIHKKNKSYRASKYYQPDVGNQENVALQIADLYGAAPFSAYPVVLKEGQLEEWLEKEIPQFIGERVLSNANLDRYEAPNAEDGINDALYNDLARHFHRIFNQKPLRPNSEFEYGENGVFTPQTFMRNHLGFVPQENVAFVATEKTHEMALEAIVETLLSNHAVPIGITEFDDEKTNLLGKFQDEGSFRGDWIDGAPDPKVVGGHEIIVVNFLYEGDPSGYKPGDKITALIIQNSWGDKVGRDINGKKTDSTHRGYFIVTSDYLAKSLKTGDKGDRWDFVLAQPVAGRFLRKLTLEH